MHLMMDKLILRKVIGGSIIERAPVFSSNGKYLCVVEKDCVRVYGTYTGECSFELRPLNGMDCDIVGIVARGNDLYGISSKGILMKWSLKSSSKVKILKLQLPHKNFTVFNLVCLDNEDDFDAKTPIRLALLMSNDNDELNTNRVTICSCTVMNEIKKTYHFSVTANNDIRSVTFGGRYDNIFVGTILGNEIRIYPYGSNRSFNCFKTGEKLTVIRAHPTDDCVAVGNTRGQIFIYYFSLNNKNKGRFTKSLYAWHILPVMDVIFSPGSGTQLYSGAAECVLVQWQVSKPELRHFLPRLPAPIVLFSISSSNTQIAVSLQNNSIVLLNPQLRTECSIQQFTWGLIPVAGQELFPAGICRDPNSGCLTLNGRPGHIQFFSLNTNSLLYNLDITETNYITQEPDVQIYNLEVTRFAFSQDGKWLATVESRHDHELSPEIRMKIWMFNESNQKFHLNTFCDVPHQDIINTVKFQPIYSLDNEKRSEYCLVTTGNDKKFRVWLSVSVQVGNKKNIVWKCERIGFYQDYPAGPAGFSSDGSVLAVGFGPCLTIWDVDNHELVASLTRDSEYLSFVEVEQTNYSHLVVGASSSQLCVWNLLTLTLVWTVPLKVSLLVADPLSDYMAAFTRDNSLFVFQPSVSQPVYEKTDLCSDGKVLAAIFVPQDDSVKTDSLPNWMHRSQLYSITSAQELLCVEMDNESEYRSTLKNFNRNDDVIIQTPFAALKAKQTKFEDDNGSVIKNRPPVGLVAEHAITKLLADPIHTMPSIKLFCSDFLKSLINKSCDKNNNITEIKPAKSKKKKNKLKEDYDRLQNEEYQRIFNNNNLTSIDCNNVSSTRDINYHDHDLLSDSNSPFNLNNSGDNMEIDDENSSDNKDIGRLADVPLNRMFIAMKNSSKKRNKFIKSKLKKKKANKNIIITAENKFVVDDAADFGLLNLYKESD